MKIGIYESEVQAMISSALGDAGLKGGYGLVLFGGKKSDALRLKPSELNAHPLKTENAALPHGSGTNRQLEASDFTLIDCGGTLHDYNSDITRVCTSI